MNTKNWIRFTLLSMIWGTNFLWTRIVVEDIGPFYLVLFRILFAFATIFLYITVLKTKIFLSWKKTGIYLILGFFNVTLPFLFISWAEQFISSGLAGIINSTFPLFALLFTTIFLPQDRISPIRFIGLLIGFSGTILLTATGLFDAQANNHLPGVIVMVMVMAPISYAIALIFARMTMRDISENEQSIGQISFALVTISLATAMLEPQLRLPSSPIVWIGVLWLGVLCTGAGTILWYSLLHSAGATRTSLIAYVSPVIAVILGSVILSEMFTWYHFAGGILVLIGVVWVNSLGNHKSEQKG